LNDGQGAALQVLVDGTNSNTALLVLSYVDQIVAKFRSDVITSVHAFAATGRPGTDIGVPP
jgi:ABC-2 type transport system permease protein